MNERRKLMAKQRYEDREYVTIDGRKIPYKVYFTKDRARPAIEEEECLRLAIAAGCVQFVISKPIQAVEDFMYYSSESQLKKWGEKYPKAIRYIAYCSCFGADGALYEDSANAAPDNVDMIKNYCVEMATKRARVRCAILALGLKGLNADIEFPDADGAAADLVEQKVEFKIKITELFILINNSVSFVFVFNLKQKTKLRSINI
jgi:hypothetical protein